jgi:hypothetical protein
MQIIVSNLFNFSLYVFIYLRYVSTPEENMNDEILGALSV